MKNPDQGSFTTPDGTEPPGSAPTTPLEGAIQVASYGVRVFPVFNAPNGVCSCSDAKLCSSPGKHPIQRNWQQSATTNTQQLQAWNRRWPNCNWGLRTDDLPTADIDPRAGGTLEAIATKLPTTAWQVSTGGGGWHWGYLPPTPPNPTPKGGNNLLGPGLDVKAKGGFVVAVGSIHATGTAYTWTNGPPDQDAITPWPPPAPETNGSGPGDTPGTTGARSTISALLASPPTSVGEGRNEWLTKVAGHVFRHFPYEDGAVEMVRTFNASLAEPLDDQELQKIIHSIGGTDTDARDARFEEAVAKRAWTMRVSEAAAREVRQTAWREPPPTLDGHQYLAQPDEEDPWSIVDLLPLGGNALLAAQFKVGKTTLLLNLVKAMCDRRPFLGKFDATLEENARVGFFNYEMSELQFRRWVRRLNVGHPERFAIADLRGFDVRLGTPDGDNWAVEWLKRWEVQAWIIDPYAKAFSGESENDNTEVARFTDAVDQIKERAGVDIAVLGAHFGRQSFETGEEHVRGATRLDDWADARWIQTKDAERERYFSAIGRDVEVQEARLGFNSKTLALTMLEGERMGRGQERLTGEILQYVARAGRHKHGEDLKAAITGKAIEENVTGQGAKIRAACKALVDRGSLVLVVGDHGERWHYPHGHPDVGQTGLRVVED